MSTKPKFRVVTLDHGFRSTEPEERIIRAAGGEFMNVEGRPYPVAMAFCSHAEVVLCRRMVVNEPMIEHFRSCKVVLRYGSGTDSVDLRAATMHRLIVASMMEGFVEESALHAISLLLACARNLLGAHRRIMAGGWDARVEEPVARMSGRTLGLVGFGSVAREVARRLAGWGLKIVAADPYVDPARAAELGVPLVRLDELCAQADYVSLHLPLQPETKHLFAARRLESMKRGVILVNTARGPLVHTDDLVAALNSGQVGRAGLDTFDEEPLPAQSPLRRHPRVLMTDHAAGYSEEAQEELQTAVAHEAVKAALGGLPKYVANTEVLSRLGRLEEWTCPEQLLWQARRDKVIPMAPVPDKPTIFTASPNLIEVARSLQRIQRPSGGPGEPKP